MGGSKKFKLGHRRKASRRKGKQLGDSSSQNAGNGSRKSKLRERGDKGVPGGVAQKQRRQESPLRGDVFYLRKNNRGEAKDYFKSRRGKGLLLKE